MTPRAPRLFARLSTSITGKFLFLLLAYTAGTIAALGGYFGYLTYYDGLRENAIRDLTSQCTVIHQRLDDHTPLTEAERQQFREFAKFAESTLTTLRRGGWIDGGYLNQLAAELSDSLTYAEAQWPRARTRLQEFATADGDEAAMARERLHNAFPRLQSALDRFKNDVENRRVALGSHMRNAFLAVCCIHLLFLAAGMWAIRRFVIRPVRLLDGRARQIAEGDYSAEAPVVSRDEIGRLARSFNRMTGELVRTIEALRASEKALEDKAAELEFSNRDLEQYAFAASHDLQEPLRMLTTYSQLLQRRHGHEVSGDGQLFLSFIEKSASRMQRLVADLLAHSRALHEAQESVPVDCNHALALAIKNCGSAIAETHAHIRSGELPVVLADETGLELVFQNLLTNAIKYRSAQNPRIDVSAAADEGKWVIRVRDNGIGIPVEHHERIFGLFKRLHGRDVPGTGVGLALAKRILEKHGGEIRVESSEGNGSTFVFTLQDASAMPKAMAQTSQSS